MANLGHISQPRYGAHCLCVFKVTCLSAVSIPTMLNSMSGKNLIF